MHKSPAYFHQSFGHWPSGGGPLYPLDAGGAGLALEETQSAKRMNVTTILDDCSHSIDTLASA